MKARTGSRDKKINLYLVPIMIIIGIIPLIVRLKEYKTYLEEYEYFSSEIFPDVYLYYKSLFFIICCSVMLVLILIQFFIKKYEIKALKLFIPLGGYALLSFLSAVFSKTPIFSFGGIFEQFESVWVLLGYAVTVYYCFIFISTIKDIDLIMAVFTAGTVIMLLIGLSQAFSVDIYRSEFGRFLILPAEYRDNENVKLTFSFPLGRVYLTLYNPNYVGSYVSLISPVFLMYAFAKKKLWIAILDIVIYIGLLLCILGSGSRAGFIGVAFSLLLLVLFFNRKLIKFLPEVMIVLVLIVGSVYTYNNYTNDQLFSRVRSALEIEKTEFNLKAIDTNDENIVVHYKEHELALSVSIDDKSGTVEVFLKDEFGVDVPFDIKANTTDDGVPCADYSFTDQRFKGITIRFLIHNNVPYFLTKIDGKAWNFCYYNGSYYYGNNKGKMTKIKTPEYVEFLSDYGRAFSGRGFIWSRTIPLLKDTIFLGTGPDTFMVNFPNNDYVGMINNGYGDELMTKPHNMYLQIAVQTGVLSLICFLTFYIWYFVTSLRIYRKAEKSGYLTMTGIGILSGTFGYMIVGIINDSMVCIAPFYWVLIGIGLAINHMIKKEEAELEKKKALEQKKSGKAKNPEPQKTVEKTGTEGTLKDHKKFRNKIKESNGKTGSEQALDRRTAAEQEAAAEQEQTADRGTAVEQEQAAEQEQVAEQRTAAEMDQAADREQTADRETAPDRETDIKKDEPSGNGGSGKKKPVHKKRRR